MMVDVPAGESVEVDFGDMPPIGGATIRGVVFADADGDGVQDGDEEGIGGVQVSLSGAASSLNTTLVDGSYFFRGLSAGAYTVNETNPVGYRSTTPDVIELKVVGDSEYEANFGDKAGPPPYDTATIYGTVFNDIDGNGAQGVGEAGIKDVRITLSGQSSNTTWTDMNGGYTFTVTSAGSYSVRETDLPEYISSTSNTVHIDDVVLGESYEADFGDFIPPDSIYGVVFKDLDRDQVRDEEEPGIGGVTVMLDGTSSNTTGSNGAYRFKVGSSGHHTVTETDLQGYESTTPNSSGR